ncbi:fimbria/pilus outer membrane usher protein [Lelliottia sp. WAP21]|uniref:fimbria/pilus outer membrane usher protein n=1 Tax=Lelliottia sp. WAP21 TaxID=2877426 RepID=UPI001E34E2CB|nr:fimbria/pilus outer membrane usher protein [Lelliottia sp. WAP21]
MGKRKILSGWLAIVIAPALTPPFACASETFNADLVELDNPRAGKVDLSAFERGTQPPGTYHVDVVLNNQLQETRDVSFDAGKNADGSPTLTPCLSVEQLAQWGVKTALFTDLVVPDHACARLAAIPQAMSEFDFAAQRLTLSIPQAAMKAQARDAVPPEQWDEGINAAMLNYSLSGATTMPRNGAATDQSEYANLRPGINLGPWRLRNYSTWSRDTTGQDQWDTVYTYLQRAVIPLKAQLTLGDSSAPSDVFDSMPFRGVQLASDDDMLPESMKGYAPVVRGIARTQAQVVVRQNGYQIYQSYVSPGAFEIRDMYPTGGAGDLEVTVKEADGSEQHFTVPFASLPVLQREGRLRYALTAGQYRSYNRDVEKTPFAQLTGIYGLPHGLTLYGGGQGASRYQAVAAGAGMNMGAFGAISADVIQAWSTPARQDASMGQSWRARYSKNFVETGTNFSIAGYRYSTKGYYGMQEILEGDRSSTDPNARRRHRAELTLSQSLGASRGSLMLSAVEEDYWNSGKPMQSVSLGYNNYWHNISYGITWSMNKNGHSTGANNASGDSSDRMLAVTISIPLEKFLPQTWASYSMNTSKTNGATHMAGLSGSALDNNALNWSVQEGYGSKGVGNTGTFTGDYKGTYAQANAGYSYDQNSARLNYGIQGGVLAHGEGITLSQPLGETNALITAPGAHGVTILNQTGARTDYRGYTVVNNLSLYRKNTLVLNTDTLPEDAELELNARTVIPVRGAVVRADYVADIGRRALIVLTTASGESVPFGASASIAGRDNRRFIVGDKGQVYVTGVRDSGKLVATWGSQRSQSCTADYRLPVDKGASGVSQLTVKCHQGK